MKCVKKKLNRKRWHKQIKTGRARIHLCGTSVPVIGAAVAAGMGVVNGSPYNSGLHDGRDLDKALRKRGAPEGDVARARALCDWCGERDLDPG